MFNDFECFKQERYDILLALFQSMWQYLNGHGLRKNKQFKIL